MSARDSRDVWVLPYVDGDAPAFPVCRLAGGIDSHSSRGVDDATLRQIRAITSQGNRSPIDVDRCHGVITESNRSLDTYTGSRTEGKLAAHRVGGWSSLQCRNRMGREVIDIEL